MRPKKNFGTVYILAAALLWSTAGVCVKFIPWSAYSIASFRSICASLLFCTVMLCTGEHRIHLTFNRWNLAGAAALFMTGILYMSAIKLTTAANAIVLQYTAPVFIILYEMLAEHKKPSKLDAVTVLCVLAGCVLSFSDRLEGGGMLGNILALASGLTFAALMVINRKPQTDPMESQLMGLILSAVLLFPFLLHDEAVVFNREAWKSLVIPVALFLGFIQYGAAHLCFGAGIKRTEPVSASIIATLEPICSPIWVFLVMKEQPGPLAIAGFAVVVCATTVYNVLLEKQKRKA